MSKIVDILLTLAVQAVAIVSRFAVAVPDTLLHFALGRIVAADWVLIDMPPAIFICSACCIVATLLVNPCAVQLGKKWIDTA